MVKHLDGGRVEFSELDNWRSHGDCATDKSMKFNSTGIYPFFSQPNKARKY